MACLIEVGEKDDVVRILKPFEDRCSRLGIDQHGVRLAGGGVDNRLGDVGRIPLGDRDDDETPVGGRERGIAVEGSDPPVTAFDSVVRRQPVERAGRGAQSEVTVTRNH